VSNPKSLGPKVSQRPTKRSSKKNDLMSKIWWKREAMKQVEGFLSKTPKEDPKSNLAIP
jgi:hypothetical protein